MFSVTRFLRIEGLTKFTSSDRTAYLVGKFISAIESRVYAHIA